MAQITLKPIVLSILLINTPLLAQAHETEQSVGLETVSVVGKSRPRATSGLLHTSTASDKIISGDTLRQKAVNLGDALDGVPGIHASQYGGGASAPVIRGQTGRRIKVLNHHGETGDMADFSPDHAIMVDTALSQQVEILRGRLRSCTARAMWRGWSMLPMEKSPKKCLKTAYRAKPDCV